MDNVERRAANIDCTFTLDVVSSLSGIGGVILGPEVAAFVTSSVEVDVERRKFADRRVLVKVAYTKIFLSFRSAAGKIFRHRANVVARYRS